mgnify:CR=1 FL=1
MRKFIVILIVVLMGCLYALWDLSSAPPGKVVKAESASVQFNKAPDVTMTDIAGNDFRLYDFEGKTVVLNIWAHGVHHASRRCLTFLSLQTVINMILCSLPYPPIEMLKQLNVFSKNCLKMCRISLTQIMSFLRMIRALKYPRVNLARICTRRALSSIRT